MQSQVMGSLKSYQIAYSTFLHPLGKTVPIEYTCETYNEIVSKFSIKVPNKTDLINDRTNMDATSFLESVVVHNVSRDPFVHQLGFIEAFERLYDITDFFSPMTNRVKMIIAEFERIEEHLIWFYELFLHSGIQIYNAFKNLRTEIHQILIHFFKLQKKRLAPSIGIGYSKISWEKEDVEHFQKALNHVYETFSLLKEKAQTSYKLKELLYDIGKMDTATTLRTGTVGPIARASAIDQDLRIDDPYFDYLSFEFKLAQSFDQDLYGLVKVLLNEITVAFGLIQEILLDDFMPKEENLLGEADVSALGSLSVRLETSKGPTLYSVECTGNMNVIGYGLSTPGIVNLNSLETRMRGVSVAHINRIIHAYNITELVMIQS